MKWTILILAIFIMICLSDTYGQKCKPKLCSHEYDPQCTRDKNGKKRTHANKCVMQNFICQHPQLKAKFWHSGKC
ncbi:hypothetical protein QE152_g31982 [Popillia japonica]|uniref:Kazal-like domain-containing protein n=1 Tax=Popillia japonica TaxID=7064 RepID=A0AAW1J0U6_POPJA